MSAVLDRPDRQTMIDAMLGQHTDWGYRCNVPPVGYMGWTEDNWIDWIGDNWFRKPSAKCQN